ncbi:MAG: sensor histidine kinase [Pseudomonadota bacterium]|jgi:two-component system sensor histidine kinase DesK
MTVVTSGTCDPGLAPRGGLAQGARMDTHDPDALRLPDWPWLARLRAWREALDRRLLPRTLAPGESAWMPLLFLAFLFLPLAFPMMRPLDIGLTLLSIVLFLPLYFGAFWLAGWRRVAMGLAMAALAPALLPVNPFANTYTIYGALSAATLSLPTALLALVGSLAMLAVSHWLIDPVAGVFVLLLTTLVSTTSLIAMRTYAATAREQAALRLSQDEVARLAKVAERERIGRDLHDLLGHTLSVIAIKAELASKLAIRDPVAAQSEIADVERVAREALGQVRRAVSGMRAVGIRAEFANARLALSAVLVDFEYRAPDLVLHPEVETVLALALREATTNIIRHAGARRVAAELLREAANVVLTVSDDGVGGAVADGNGLKGMRERLAALGGTLAIESQAGQGTRLRIVVPWRDPGSDEAGRERATVRHLRAVG